MEAERKAIEIRIRAERKVGALLAELQKFKGGGDRKSNHSAQPEPSGLSKKGRPAQDRDLGNVDTDSGLYSERFSGIGDGFRAFT